MNTIPLTKNQQTLVSDDDYEYLSQYKWFFNNGYAARSMGKKIIYMHREIMGFVSGKEVDHINGDRLDNRKSNLRLSNRKQNARNSSMHRDSRAPYKGVKLQTNGRFYASIRVDYKMIYLGGYDTAKKAAKAYNDAAKMYFGEFAKLNPI